MMITNKINLDLQKPGTTPTIHAVQNDSYSRNLEITLYADRLPFVFPETGRVLIRYRKSDGKGGEYDTLPDGRCAWWTSRNVLTIALAPQVLTTPGSVLLSVTLLDGETQLSVFPIRIAVEPIAAAKLAISENYFYTTGLLPAPVSGAVGQCLQIAAVNENGRITALKSVDMAMPQKGIDYWTSDDKEQIIQDVITALGTPVLGTVDNENNIILTGTLADGTYTLKYEFADGSVITIGTLEHHASTTDYTNQIPISTDYDDSIYNGTGYASGARIRSNGEVGTVTYTNAPNIIFLTGFIPVKNGDVVRMKNCFLDAHSSNNDETAQTYGNFIGTIYTAFYDSDKTELGKITWMEMREANEWFTYTPNSDGNVTEFTVTGENVAYLRLNPSCDGDPADAIITVNEEIPE